MKSEQRTTVYAPNSNSATQTNNQSNGLGQTQTVNGSGWGCCLSGTGDVKQEATQSNDAENTATQHGLRPVGYVSSGGNYAFGNKGDVSQNSGNIVYAPSSNSATQTNNQSNGLGQTQTVNGSGWGCCGSGDADAVGLSQSNSGENSADQTAYLGSGRRERKNVTAFLNSRRSHTEQRQQRERSEQRTQQTQGNNQSNNLGQSQTVDRGGCCPPSDCNSPCTPPARRLRASRSPVCEPKPCPPPPCEPKPCQPRCNPCAAKRPLLKSRLLGTRGVI